MRWHCDLCGGPRLPRADPAFRRSKREVMHLKRAEGARRARAKSRAFIFGASMMGFGSTALLGLWGLIFSFSFPLVLTWALFAGAAALVIVWALGRSSNATKELKAAIDQAWMAAAGDVANRMKGAFSAQKLAQAMGIDEVQAEEMLALLEANDVIRSDVTEAGELAYQTKFRVGAVDTGAGEVDLEALAEAEAIAEEQRLKAQK
ncbi:MAG: hypothetical protein IPK82_10895 [Polyangiaceae bacterium]|nr:hypothetical protein [Polyangiaceae bacterium]